MKATRIYTREDIRDLWRRYQHGDMAAGNDFALVANAQGKTFQALQAEIEPECREEDAAAGLQYHYQSRAAETCRNSRFGRKPRHISNDSLTCLTGRRLGSSSWRIQPWRNSTRASHVRRGRD